MKDTDNTEIVHVCDGVWERKKKHLRIRNWLKWCQVISIVCVV